MRRMYDEEDDGIKRRRTTTHEVLKWFSPNELTFTVLGYVNTRFTKL